LEAVILAGGFGTRLREVVADVPKPMAKVGEKPFLEILLMNLELKGFKRVILSLGFKAEIIKHYFGTNFRDIELVYEVETTPLGTGGALKAALANCKEDYSFVFNGDTFLDLEVADLQRIWEADHTPIIVAREVSDVSRYGQLYLSNGRITRFLPKGGAGSGLINAGCYLLPKDIFKNYNYCASFSLEEDFLPKYIQSNFVGVFTSRGYFIDIGIPADYFRAQRELISVR
jgi:D-glycero-alpha-D-manno-heptose 1-phosphate guanylyltransferase